MTLDGGGGGGPRPVAPETVPAIIPEPVPEGDDKLFALILLVENQ